MVDRRDSVSPTNAVSGLAWKICVTTISRLILNTARRFAYPFAPVLSRGLGVPLTAITSMIAVNQATGFLGMFFGPLADHFGYRLIMLAGLGMLVGGMFAAGFLPFYAVVLIALFLAGLGKSIFDPALQAYVGKRVPFHRRGMVVGIMELSWAGSTLVGIPLIGLMIDRFGWRAPFFALGGLGLLGMAAIRLWIRKDDKAAAGRVAVGFRRRWREMVRVRAVRGALVFSFLFSAANDNLFIVYGAWLEDSFGLSVVALGLGTGVIGVAELCGELLTASLSDRFGLKNSLLAGVALSAAAYALLPLLGGQLALAVTGLFFTFLTYEFSVVTYLSLCTELAPEARATAMSGFLACAGLGRVVGALSGGTLWLAGGIMATGLASAGVSLLAGIALAWGLRGWQR